VTIDELVEQIDAKYGIAVSLDALWHILQRMAEIKVVEGIPVEKERILIRLEHIQYYLPKLKQQIKGATREFTANIDESGCTDFADAGKAKVVEPGDLANLTIPIPTNRAEKRATITAGIAGDGTALKPMIILPRKN
jgi:hypothetical protein